MRKALFLALAVLGAASQVAAAEYPAMSIRLSHNQPVDSPEDTGAQRFKALMEERSGGKITVEVFPQMQLGSMREQAEMVQMGMLEMTLQPTAVLTPFVEEVQIIDFPFLWAGREQLYRIMDGEVGQRFFAHCEARGFRALGLWTGGFKQITTKGRQVKGPDDLKGMKIRVMPSPLLVEQYKAWGANPIPIEYAELYSSLQQNIVDGQENPIQSIAMGRFYEVQDYLTLSSHGFLGYLFVANADWFNRQSEEVRALIADCEREARGVERAAQAEGEARFLDQIRQSRIVVSELSPEARQTFTSVSRPLHESFARTDAMRALLQAIYEAH